MLQVNKRHITHWTTGPFRFVVEENTLHFGIGAVRDYVGWWAYNYSCMTHDTWFMPHTVTRPDQIMFSSLEVKLSQLAPSKGPSMIMSFLTSIFESTKSCIFVVYHTYLNKWGRRESTVPYSRDNPFLVGRTLVFDRTPLGHQLKQLKQAPVWRNWELECVWGAFNWDLYCENTINCGRILMRKPTKKRRRVYDQRIIQRKQVRS